MTQYIHYEANIFMLHDLLKHIKRGLKLDIDSIYFQHKMETDLVFANRNLVQFYESLKDSTLQLDKTQYFRHLYKAKNLYIEIAESILNGTSGRSFNFENFRPQLEESLSEQRFEVSEIGKLLSQATSEEPDTDQISQEELMFLMSSDEEEE